MELRNLLNQRNELGRAIAAARKNGRKNDEEKYRQEQLKVIEKIKEVENK